MFEIPSEYLLFGFVSLLVFLAASIWLHHAGLRRRERVHHQAQAFAAALARYQSGQELQDFLNTDGGRHLISEFGTLDRVPVNRLLLSSIWLSIVLACVGLAFVGIALIAKEPLPGAIGGVAIALAIGLALAAQITRRVSAGLEDSSDSQV